MTRKNFRQTENRKNQEGQALVEFVLGLMVIISFFFFYVKMAAVFAIGNYIHYATFMAARAFQSSAQSEEVQTENAETVLRKMLAGRWKAAIKPVGGDSSVPGAHVGKGPYAAEDFAVDHWNQGVTYSFQAKLALYPWSQQGQSILLKLTSESWSPREESMNECEQTKQNILNAIQATAVGKAMRLEWDNGC